MLLALIIHRKFSNCFLQKNEWRVVLVAFSITWHILMHLDLWTELWIFLEEESSTIVISQCPILTSEILKRKIPERNRDFEAYVPMKLCAKYNLIKSWHKLFFELKFYECIWFENEIFTLKTGAGTGVSVDFDFRNNKKLCRYSELLI